MVPTQLWKIVALANTVWDIKVPTARPAQLVTIVHHHMTCQSFAQEECPPQLAPNCAKLTTTITFRLTLPQPDNGLTMCARLVNTMFTMLLMPSPGATHAHVVTSAQPRPPTLFLVNQDTTNKMKVKLTVNSARATTCAHSPITIRLHAQSRPQATDQKAIRQMLAQLAATQSMALVIQPLVQLLIDGLNQWLAH